MKTVTVENKFVHEVSLLQEDLRSNGFPSAVVISQESSPPKVIVYLDDSETGDPTSKVLAFVDPNRLVAASDKPSGPDGIPEAQGDGADVHTVTIYKKNYDGTEVISGTEVVRSMPAQLIAVNPRLVQLVAGIGRLSVGPTTMAGEVSINFVDQGGNLLAGRLTVRFI